MSKIRIWCGERFLKARWAMEGIPCDTDEEFKQALASMKNVSIVWDGDNYFYEIFIEIEELGAEGYSEVWMDEASKLRYVSFKLPDTPSKPKQSTPFWANAWRKKHKRK